MPTEMPPRELPAALNFLLAARRSELAGLQRLEETCQLVRLSGQLIHALQRERGYSNVFLGDVRIAQHSLDEYSLLAGQLEARVCQWLEPLQHDAGERARLLDRVAHALYGMASLPDLRRRIRARQLPASEASRAFTQLIGGLLNVIFEAAGSVADAELTHRLVALFNFLQGKELAGQERSLGVQALSQGFFDDAQKHQLEALIDGQQRCFETFLRHSDPQLQQDWSTRHDDLAALQQLRALARRTSAQQRVDAQLAQTWFEVCSQRLDALHRLEAQLDSVLQQQCREQIARARKALDNHRALCRELAEQAGQTPVAHWFSVREHPLQQTADEPRTARSEHQLLSLLQAQHLRLQQLDEALQTARHSLDERRHIEQAKRLLMEHQGLSEAEAHERLRRLAMDHGWRLGDAACRLLELRQAAMPQK